MAKEDGRFGIDQVLDTLAEKLMSRHPHVFGDVKAETSQEVLRNWEAIKARERGNGAAKEKEKSILSGVSSAMPALMEASKLSSRAANVGFDWPNIEGLLDKLKEETEELKSELAKYPAPGPSPQRRGVASSSDPNKAIVPQDLQPRLEGEIGDLFFVLVNIARYLSIDPESALRKTNRKFRERFQHVESGLRDAGQKWEDVSQEKMEELWQQAKQRERT